MRRFAWGVVAAAALYCVSAQSAHAYAPLSTEITPSHPLFVFTGPRLDDVPPPEWGNAIIAAWVRLPDELKPYSALIVDAARGEGGSQETLGAALGVLQEAAVPVVLRLADGGSARMLTLDEAESLVSAFPTIRGIQAVGLRFNVYDAFAGGDDLATPPNVRWLVGAMEIAASYGRFFWIELDEVNWLRVMANADCRPLYEKMLVCRDYVIPAVPQRGDHIVPQMSAALGLWLEGAAANWAVAADSAYYREAGYAAPGRFGQTADRSAMPASLYRAMILNGAMIGACAYSFAPAEHLWHGESPGYWNDAIAPTLRELVDQHGIAEQRFVSDKAVVAYQLALAYMPLDFHLNLRDVDGVLDEGYMMHGAYGMERPGQIAELIPNSGRHYWAPILSPYASDSIVNGFTTVVRPGAIPSAQEWTVLLDRHYTPDAGGSAFTARVGRNVYVLNTRENTRETQPFRIPNMPTPVRGIKAVHGENGVHLSWPWREGDLVYRVLKRRVPETAYVEAVADLDTWEWQDISVGPDETMAYTVLALTSAQEVYEGSVNYGQYLLLSTVESRIAEEVIVAPGQQAISAPFPIAAEEGLSDDWWGLATLVESERVVAQAIADRFEAWEDALRREDLDAVLDLYDTNYQDPQGWRFQYVGRAFQWFFERYDFCRVARQVRRWDFTRYQGDGVVRVLLYCRVMGVAITDPTGHVADQRVHFPRSTHGEQWLTFIQSDGAWRILQTDPAFPNFKDILGYSVGPHDDFVPGPDG